MVLPADQTAWFIVPLPLAKGEQKNVRRRISAALSRRNKNAGTRFGLITEDRQLKVYLQKEGYVMTDWAEEVSDDHLHAIKTRAEQGQLTEDDEDVLNEIGVFEGAHDLVPPGVVYGFETLVSCLVLTLPVGPMIEKFIEKLG